jgi:hypothetical protein
MKKLILSMIGCLISISTFAQIESGKKFIGSQFGGSINSGKEYGRDMTMYSLQVSPTIGYFLNNHWMVGLQVDISFTDSTNNIIFNPPSNAGHVTYPSGYDIEKSSFRIGFAPIVRYYIPTGSRFAFFAEASAGLSRTKTTGSQEAWTGGYSFPGGSGPIVVDPNGTPIKNTNKYEFEQDSFSSGIAPGVVFFATPKLGIEIKVSILQYTYGINDSRTPLIETKPQEFKADFSLANSRFGASFYF